MLCIVSFALMLVSLSASVDKDRDAQIGHTAPTLVVERNGSAASLQQMRGKRVILSFWSAADAQSRMEQNRIVAMTGGSVAGHFDRSERLMDEIVSYDNLDPSSQFHVGTPDDAAAVRDAFQLHNGLRTFIIDEQGKKYTPPQLHGHSAAVPFRFIPCGLPHGGETENLRTELEVHRVIVIPCPAPYKAVAPEYLHEFVRYTVGI